MIFRKNKPAPGPGDTNHAMRGRDSEPGDRGASALARRFLVDDEPDTIDLVEPGMFPESGRGEEPETRETSVDTPESTGPERNGFISRDPETGKFYVHPGDTETQVMLGGEPVTAATELRKGDRIEMAGATFEFLA